MGMHVRYSQAMPIMTVWPGIKERVSLDTFYYTTTSFMGDSECHVLYLYLYSLHWTISMH